MFQTIDTRNKISFYFALYTIPLAWLYISALCKADNITNLTTDPPLTSFDTFDSLVQNNFQTYSRSFKLRNMSTIQSTTTKNGNLTSHKRFPFVSEFWGRVMEQLG